VSNPAIRAGITLGPMSGELLNLELSALEQENQRIRPLPNTTGVTSMPSTASLNSIAVAPLLPDFTSSNPAIRAGITLGPMSGELLNLELSALEQENQIEIIAAA
jgi:type II secretory pathway component HofQ